MLMETPTSAANAADAVTESKVASNTRFMVPFRLVRRFNARATVREDLTAADYRQAANAADQDAGAAAALCLIGTAPFPPLTHPRDADRTAPATGPPRREASRTTSKSARPAQIDGSCNGNETTMQRVGS